MIRRILSVLLFFPLFLSTAALADETGIYLGLNAGANILARDSENSTSTGNFNFGFKPGYQGNLTLGYRLAPGSSYGTGRVELELGYRQNNIDRIAFTDGEFSAKGEVTVWDVMLNTYGEFPNQSVWTPYVGGGLGAAIVSWSRVEMSGVPVVDDAALVLAYQLAAGVSYALSPSLELDCGYRFFGTSTPEFKDVSGVAFDSEYQVHNLQLGIRFVF